MRKILVAEDNRLNRCLLKELLEGRGFEVLIATDGQEALEKALSETPDLILMDIQMPVLDGIECCKRIRSSNRSVKIFATTALAMKGDREKIMQAGFDDYLSKPLDTRKLAKRIDDLFVLRRNPCVKGEN